MRSAQTKADFIRVCLRWALRLSVIALMGLFVLGAIDYVNGYMFRYSGSFTERMLAGVWESFEPPEWHVRMSADVPGHGVIEFRSRWRASRTTNEYAFRWYASSNQVHDYYLFQSFHGISGCLQLCATEDGSGVWLQRPQFFEELKSRLSEEGLRQAVSQPYNRDWMLAALDTSTGEAVGGQNYLYDCSFPVQEQMRHFMGSAPWPDWATPEGGIVLAEHNCD